MILLLAVLVLLGSTQVIGGFPDHVLPPLARYGWWTIHVYAVGLAGVYHTYGEWHWKQVGVLSATIFFSSYGFMWSDYLAMMPTQPEGFHWQTVFAVVNVILPIAMVTAGSIIPVVRVGRES